LQVARFGYDLHDMASPGTPLFDLRAAREMTSIGIQHDASHPPLVAVAALSHWLLGLLGITCQLVAVCALVIPVCAANSCMVMYHLGKEFSTDDAVGLLGAAFLAILPASTASTVSGSFGAQGLAFFPLLLTILFYLRALKSERTMRSVAYAAAASAALMLVALTWRPYALFLLYLIPFHVAFACVCW
jgi:asparagine N-glycosylation enzyme membrane subunit Stt3